MAKWRDYLEPGDDVGLADMAEPDLDVPRAMGVLFGAQVGWSPARESQPIGHCTVCGNGRPHTPIQPGSRQYCAGCGRYGLDRQIVELLAEHPAPRPDDTPVPIESGVVGDSARRPDNAHAELAKGRITVPDRYSHLIEKD